MSPSLTRADVAMLGRRAQQPVKEPGELLAIFVAGPVKNPLNGSLSRAHWSKKSRWAKGWRERTQMVLLEAIQALPFGMLPADKRAPKLCEFTAHLVRRMDDDNLAASMKPCRDALKDMRVIHEDDPTSGHVFRYRQTNVSGRRGVEIRVSPR